MAGRKERRLRTVSDILNSPEVIGNDLDRMIFDNIFEEITSHRVPHYEFTKESNVIKIPQLDVEGIPASIGFDYPRKGGHTRFFMAVEGGKQGQWDRRNDYSLAYGAVDSTKKPLMIGSVHEPRRSDLFPLLLGDFPADFATYEDYVTFWLWLSRDRKALQGLVGNRNERKEYAQAIKNTFDPASFAVDVVRDLHDLVNFFLPREYID